MISPCVTPSVFITPWVSCVWPSLPSDKTRLSVGAGVGVGIGVNAGVDAVVGVGVDVDVGVSVGV